MLVSLREDPPRVYPVLVLPVAPGVAVSDDAQALLLHWDPQPHAAVSYRRRPDSG